jgi:hypothetical protein
MTVMKERTLNEQTPKDCKKFDSCSAPICPLALGSYIWYPDEEICKYLMFAKLVWIRNQKKIAKRAKDNDTYYTLGMLKQKCVIRKGITGLDPDKDISKQKKDVLNWLQDHPEIKDERRVQLSKNMKEKRMGNSGRMTA